MSSLSVLFSSIVLQIEMLISPRLRDFEGGFLVGESFPLGVPSLKENLALLKESKVEVRSRLKASFDGKGLLFSFNLKYD